MDNVDRFIASTLLIWSLVLACSNGRDRDTYTDSDADTSTDGDIDIDIDTDSDSDTEPDAGGDVDTDTDTLYQWHTFYGSKTSSYGWGLAVDQDSNLFVTGIAMTPWSGPNGEPPLNPDSGGGSYATFVLRLDPVGEYQWHTFYGAFHSSSYSLAMDESDGIYVSGSSSGPWYGPNGELPLNNPPTDHPEMHIIKLDTDGNYQWHTFYGDYSDTGYAISMDSAGDLYAAGQAASNWFGPSGQEPLNPHCDFADISILKLNSDGEYLWHTFYGGVQWDTVFSIAILESGDIAVTGRSSNPWVGPNG